MDLVEIRKEIDQIDADLIALLEKRMALVSQVALYKRQTGKAVLYTQREQVILEKVANSVHEKQYEESIVQTFSDILKHSRAYQDQHIK